MAHQIAPGELIVFSGPSGAGKSTVLDALIAKYSGRLRLAVSATTRTPRPGEVDGDDYHFLSRAEFDAMRRRGDFLECVEVFGGGDWYGTLNREVGPSLAAGKWVILEIDVRGANEILKVYPNAETIFLAPSSIEEIERRLRLRGTETEEAIARRLAAARRELNDAANYRHQVMNDTVDDAVQQIIQILSNKGLSP